MKKIFKENLLKLITKEIKGKVYLHYKNDDLYIELTANDNTFFRYIIYDIEVKISTGFSTNTALQMFYNAYKKFILSKYFYINFK